MWKSLLNRRIKAGSLRIVLPNGQQEVFGKGPPEAEMVIHRRQALFEMLLNPHLKIGECYMNGDWSAGKSGLLAVLEVLFHNLRLQENRHGWLDQCIRLKRWIEEHNSAVLSRRNVHHHYDIDNDLYCAFLDADMQYSCAYFESPDMDLEAAQQAKCAHIGRKLILKPGQKVLDIGCGWGGMALYLAREYQVEMVGLTLSDEQLTVAQQRAKQAGLQDRVRFALQDYREHEGQYDAIVSVGMFEHVGRPQFGVFFDKSKDLLKEDGRLLLHTIGHTGPPALSNVWIRKYIFPGSYIPALSEVVPAIEDSGLAMTDIEVLHGHYADTLKNWHQRFQARREEFAGKLGERFCRMWEFYLQTSEAGFRWYDLVVFQIQAVADHALAPRTRDYIYRQTVKAKKSQPRRRASAASRTRRQKSG